MVLSQGCFNLYIATPYLLKPLVEPKELKRIDGIIAILNPDSPTPFSDVFPFIEKIYLALQSFVPMYFFAYFGTEPAERDDIFFKMLEIKDFFDDKYKTQVRVAQLHLNNPDSFFEGRLKHFREDMEKMPFSDKMPKLKIQNLLNGLKAQFEEIDQHAYDLASGVSHLL
ncbi:MAG TPA: hypothetical protein VKK79_19570, partial [Candidatus Lokiarchaeia archaeon]|nr:hypothetical protein [Candidatus Lokiarchaeia archaeon]